MIVDVHGHWGPWFFSMEVGGVETNLELLDRYGIDLQLVSAVEAIVYDAASGNRAIVPQLQGADRLRGLLVVDPRDLDQARRDLDELLPTGLFVGAKVHTGYSGVPIASETMHAALRLTAAAGLPTLVHTWGPDVVDLARAADAIPDARLVAGHMGGPAWRLVPEAASISDRIWFEPCYSLPDAGRVRWVLDQIGPSRMLFGTDATLIDPAIALGAIEGAGLSEGEREAVMAANALALFDLTPAVAR